MNLSGSTLNSLIGKYVYIEWADDSDWNHFRVDDVDISHDMISLTGVEDRSTGCQHSGDSFDVDIGLIKMIKPVNHALFNLAEWVEHERELTKAIFETKMNYLVDRFEAGLKRQNPGVVVLMKYVDVDGPRSTLWVTGMDDRALVGFWGTIKNAWPYWTNEGDNLPGNTLPLGEELAAELYQRLVDKSPETTWTGCLYRDKKGWLMTNDGGFLFVRSVPPNPTY
jgi:hypothetical protein